MPRLDPFQKRISYAFRNQGLMVLALTHPSVGHEKDKAESNNQRLEFLGDAVLQLVISATLYKQFLQHDEGTLSKVRARLVNREELATRARDIKLGAQLIVSRGEEKNGGRNRESALADAFEALIGAIYLDGGFTKVRLFILTQFKTALKDVDVGQHVGNPRVSCKSYCKPTRRYHLSTGCWIRPARIMTVHSSALYATRDVNWPAAKVKAKKLPKPKPKASRLKQLRRS